MSETGLLDFKYFKERGEADVLKKDRKSLRVPPGEIVVGNAQVETDDHAHSVTTKLLSGKAILIFRSIAIEFLNYRFATASFVGVEYLLRILNYNVMKKIAMV